MSVFPVWILVNVTLSCSDLNTNACIYAPSPTLIYKKKYKLIDFNNIDEGVNQIEADRMIVGFTTTIAISAYYY